MIRNFRCKDIKNIYQRTGSRRFRSIETLALRKLLMLNVASRIDDLRIPPGNRLEKLTGNRSEQYSIRINGQWRLCFRWENTFAVDVEIVDYH